jgi:hypothetical protein
MLVHPTEKHKISAGASYIFHKFGINVLIKSNTEDNKIPTYRSHTVDEDACLGGHVFKRVRLRNVCADNTDMGQIHAYN